MQNFQLDMSKPVGEKCGKLHITYILSSQRGITPSKIDAKWRHSNLICSTLKQSHVQKFQLNMSKHVREKSGKRADGDPDGRTEESDGRTDGRRHGRTSPYHNTSRLKTGVIIKIPCISIPCIFDFIESIFKNQKLSLKFFQVVKWYGIIFTQIFIYCNIQFTDIMND